MIHQSRKNSLSVGLPGVQVLIALACAALLLLGACATKDPLIGKWTASQAEPVGKPALDKAQLDALGMSMTIQLNEDKSFVLEMGKSSFKGSWDYAMDAKKLNLKNDAAQSTNKELPSLSFEAVDVVAGKSLKMSMSLGAGQPNIAFTYLPAK